jgi:serine/threonine-protein kinase HipA
VNGQHLIALLSGRDIGHVRRDKRNRLLFTYRDEWRAFPGAFPLSLSMPLAVADHRHEEIEAFLWGLLPDNEFILGRWARRFQVSARNPFALLSHVGEDCAGAIQFLRPDRLDAVLAPGAPEIVWLDATGVAERLRALRNDSAAWRSPSDTGQFSLAGAQPKTALLYENGRWGVPSGRMPTTHILKPPTGEFDGHVENEHFCLALARALELPAASSEVRRFEGEVAIVIERYDRAYTSALAAAAAAESAARAAEAATADNPAAAAKATAAAAARAQGLAELAKTQPILRLHQEDACQALGLSPLLKYQNEGGPSPEDIVALLRAHSSRPHEDVGTFFDSLAFNWLIAGTDAHAKNYSVLHGGGGRVRLAPLYDVASALPYDELDPRRIKLAMKIGGEYRVRDIGARQWRRLASDVRLDPDETIARVRRLASLIPERASAIKDRVKEEGLRHPIVDRLGDALAARAQECRRTLES